MKMNFCLPPSELTGGPLAIMEYANGLQERGHEVSITTYPVSCWPKEWQENKKPYAWYNFKGKYIIVDDVTYRKSLSLACEVFLGVNGEVDKKKQAGYNGVLSNLAVVLSLIDCFPDCDVNIATAWLSAYAVYFSKKGKPVYFMQHYEEVFQRKDDNKLLEILSTRDTYSLPLYKIANSSWLKNQIARKFGQEIPYSLNAIRVDDFSPQKKWSVEDGVIRLLSYSDEREWKGFADVAAAVSILRKLYPGKYEWHVFGRLHSRILPDNVDAPYILHKRIPFSELADLYARVDILICASWYESFPLPPLEAMASGTAVITTPYGTEDYCYDRKNCLVVKPRNIKSIVDAVCCIATNKELSKRIIKEGLKIAKGFTWEKAIDKREKFLIDIVNGNVKYDRFFPIDTGFVDGDGVGFMQMPKDLLEKYPDGVYIKNDERVFLIQHGCKRRIANKDILARICHTEKVIDVDSIECMRIPMGFTIRSEADL